MIVDGSSKVSLSNKMSQSSGDNALNVQRKHKYIEEVVIAAVV
jgi:hypothetical protein